MQFPEAMAHAGEEERRRYERIAGNGADAALHATGRAAQRAVIIDISRGGAACRCDWPLAAGIEVQLEIAGNDGVVARVVRSEAGALALAFRQDEGVLRHVDKALAQIAARSQCIAA